MSPLQFLFLVLVFGSVVCSSKKPSGDTLDENQLQTILQFLPTVYSALSVISSVDPIFRPGLARALMKSYFNADDDQDLEMGIRNILPAIDAIATKLINLENTDERSTTSLDKLTSVKKNNDIYNKTLLNISMSNNTNEQDGKSTPNTTFIKNTRTGSIESKHYMHFTPIPISLHLDAKRDDDTGLKHLSNMKPQTSKSDLKTEEAEKSSIDNETRNSKDSDDDNHNFDVNDDGFDDVDADADISYEYYYDYDEMIEHYLQKTTSIENKQVHETNSPNNNISPIVNHKITNRKSLSVDSHPISRTHTPISKITWADIDEMADTSLNAKIPLIHEPQNLVNNLAQLTKGEINSPNPNSEIKNMNSYKSQQEESLKTISNSNYQKNIMKDKIDLDLDDSNVSESETSQGIEMEISVSSQIPLPDLKMIPRRNMHKSDDKIFRRITTKKDDMPHGNRPQHTMNVNLSDSKAKNPMNRNIEKKKNGRSNMRTYGDKNYDFVLDLIGKPIVIA